MRVIRPASDLFVCQIKLRQQRHYPCLPHNRCAAALPDAVGIGPEKRINIEFWLSNARPALLSAGVRPSIKIKLVFLVPPVCRIELPRVNGYAALDEFARIHAHCCKQQDNYLLVVPKVCA